MSEQRLSAGGADVVDRLVRLRAILPAMAADLASARRQINTLALENERLTRRVAQLESDARAARETSGASVRGTA